MADISLINLPSDEYQWTLLMATLVHVIGAVREQAIIWRSVNQDLRHYMASLGHSKLIHYALC